MEPKLYRKKYLTPAQLLTESIEDMHEPWRDRLNYLGDGRVEVTTNEGKLIGIVGRHFICQGPHGGIYPNDELLDTCVEA